MQVNVHLLIELKGEEEQAKTEELINFENYSDKEASS